MALLGPSPVDCCSHSVIEGHQIDQAQLSLSKAMLAVLDHLLVLYLDSRSLASMKVCSVIFPGAKVRLTNLQFPFLLEGSEMNITILCS